MKLLYRWFKSEPPLISREAALTIAQDECKRRQWVWREPVEIKLHFGQWRIYTNSKGRGVNARIAIDSQTGEILEAFLRQDSVEV